MELVTARLLLVPASLESIAAAMDGSAALGARLGAAVPLTWPPEFMDHDAFKFTLDRLNEGPAQAGWWLYFVLLPGGDGGRTLIGTAGYKGPPDLAGTVEVGYGIVGDHQRRGYASEAASALVARAFSVPAVARVIAETLPALIPSIGVLRKCGFRKIDESSEAGVIRFELRRADYPQG